MQALKVLVIGMGVLIVLGLALVAFGLVSRMSKDGTGRTGFGDVKLALPPGCGLAEARASDGRLVVRSDGPAERGCQQVFVIDMASGKILGRVLGAQEQ